MTVHQFPIFDICQFIPWVGFEYYWEVIITEKYDLGAMKPIFNMKEIMHVLENGVWLRGSNKLKGIKY